MKTSLNIQIRLASPDDMTWVNERYREVSFIESDYNREKIAIAEVNGEKVGIGRLIFLENKTIELGGMYVMDSYRKHGVAKQIIQFLLDQVQKGENVYCIPFAHLYNFYHQFGFDLCDNQAKVPQALLDKRAWCRKKYPQEALLMCKEGSSVVQ